MSSIRCIDCGAEPTHGTVTLHYLGARGDYDVCSRCAKAYREHRKQIVAEAEAKKAAAV